MGNGVVLRKLADAFAETLAGRDWIEFHGGDAVAVLYACGGPRVEAFGTESHGVVVASFGAASAVSFVPSRVWSVCWEGFPRYE